MIGKIAGYKTYSVAILTALVAISQFVPALKMPGDLRNAIAVLGGCLIAILFRKKLGVIETNNK